MNWLRIGWIGLISLLVSFSCVAKIVIAVDAGHGGHDSGAVGKTFKLQEKEVTLAIAKELKTLLNADSRFKAVMTRSGDYFVELYERPEIARKSGAHLLISIHADSLKDATRNVRGSTVWLQSTERVDNELSKWLDDDEKQSELLGGAGTVLSNNKERYFNRTILDLQFSHTRRSSYELGKHILTSLGRVSPPFSSTPRYKSLAVLRAPDIPSVLIEAGFLSTAEEEKRLATTAYRKQLARAIYNGIVSYTNKNFRNFNSSRTTVVTENKTKTKSTKAHLKKENQNQNNTTEKTRDIKKQNDAQKTVEKQTNNSTHIVQKDETVYSIARIYNTTPDKISKWNNLKNYKIHTGQKLKVR